MKSVQICLTCRTPVKKLKHTTLCGCGIKLATLHRHKLPKSG